MPRELRLSRPWDRCDHLIARPEENKPRRSCRQTASDTDHRGQGRTQSRSRSTRTNGIVYPRRTTRLRVPPRSRSGDARNRCSLRLQRRACRRNREVLRESRNGHRVRWLTLFYSRRPASRHGARGPIAILFNRPESESFGDHTFRPGITPAGSRSGRSPRGSCCSAGRRERVSFRRFRERQGSSSSDVVAAYSLSSRIPVDALS